MSKVPSTLCELAYTWFLKYLRPPTTSTTRLIPKIVALSGFPALRLATGSIPSIIQYIDRLKAFINPFSGPRTQQAIFSLSINGFLVIFYKIESLAGSVATALKELRGTCAYTYTAGSGLYGSKLPWVHLRLTKETRPSCDSDRRSSKVRATIVKSYLQVNKFPRL